ncbi:MAG: NAD(P)/FAD-dependent oxidoreductase [Ferruginibacter sp.]|nr:NAD(P)/FAD-dependent oxidoreductase [Ferruginibacter sp.]
MMKQTEVLVIGASVSGLALAASLQKQGIDYLIIEKQAQVGAPWRQHYERLHLHTNKRVSNLPFKKFGSEIPRYPSRRQVVSYLDDYQKTFHIHPIFDSEATSIRREQDHWITETSNGIYQSKYLVMATGAFGKPRQILIKGMESFPGRILHSAVYKTGEAFKAQRVLIVGFGNSACEIAIDLYEQGASPSMSVRSPVNIIPRDVAGIPILEISQLMSRLPARVADLLSAPLMRMIFGDITKLGLQKKTYGAFEEIEKDGKIPVLDIGVVKHIRKGHIKVFCGIDHIAGNTVHFADGKKAEFDSIVACIGYDRVDTGLLKVEQERFEDLDVCLDRQQYCGKDGLYFCGFWVGPTGQIREIAVDAVKIAKDISIKQHALRNTR